MQLGDYDVSAAILAAAGARLSELIGDQGAASVDDIHGPPPIDGWRLIAGDIDSPRAQQPVLAAPWMNARSNGVDGHHSFPLGRSLVCGY
jgi:hypothetical protein